MKAYESSITNKLYKNIEDLKKDERDFIKSYLYNNLEWMEYKGDLIELDLLFDAFDRFGKDIALDILDKLRTENGND